MDEVNNTDGSQSVNDDRNHSRIGKRLSFSPITHPPSQDKNGDAESQPADKKDDDNEDDGIEADCEDPPAAGVEEYISVLPRSLLPPSTTDNPSKKNNRECASQGIRFQHTCENPMSKLHLKLTEGASTSSRTYNNCSPNYCTYT